MSKPFSNEQFAHKYVLSVLAKNIPPEAIQASLTAGILLKGLLAEWQVYAAAQDAIVVRPDECQQMLPTGVWESLTPTKRKSIRNAINKEAERHRKGVRSLLAFVQEQVKSVDAGSDAFKTAYKDNETDYLTTPVQ